MDTHIGCIYGDAITTERCITICKKLKDKGFASTNIVFGIGSYTYQYNTRDTFGFALKSTYAVVNGEEKKLFKDPITDNGIKKSQKGLVLVRNISNDDDISQLSYMDDMNKADYDLAKSKFGDLLEPLFIDGKLLREDSLCEIRNRLLDNE